MAKKICKPCIKQQMYYAHLKQVAKQRAIDEERSYSIWFDTEDEKYYSLPYEDATDKRNEQDFEVISKYP